MDRKQQLGRLLQEAREARGWSQREYAKKFGCAHTAIGAKERGEQDLSLSELEQHAKLLGVPIEYFLKGHQSEPRSAEAIVAELAQQIKELTTRANQASTGIKMLPIYESLVVNGNGELDPANKPVTEIPVRDEDWSPTVIGLRIRGMTLGDLTDGTTAFIDMGKQPSNKSLVMCSKTDNGVSLKRYRKEEGANIWLEDEDRPYPLHEYRVLGVVIGMARKYDTAQV